ncbi:MAG: DUF1566 domain-containing protein [Desulfurivibrionaceae bacterium]
MRYNNILHTCQTRCYDSTGQEINCSGSGQDGEYRAGLCCPEPRFEVQGETVLDNLTGLIWSRNANPNDFPVTWQEALDLVGEMNDNGFLGAGDWRLPNRRELKSLISYQDKKPCLPGGHPFTNTFLNWYWTSTSAAINPAYAWYIHLEGARMFYGRKNQNYLFWPVRGPGDTPLLQTGQGRCYASTGEEINCSGSGQDGEFRNGRPWPEPRFREEGNIVCDQLTNLCWLQKADLTGAPEDWQGALNTVSKLNSKKTGGIDNWRLPNINELESLVDCSCHSPALPSGHPFSALQEGYWSSTTSFFETDWAWVLYLAKGACGVGHKPGRSFYVWPVCDSPLP